MTTGPAEDTRTRLLRNALQLFTDHGVEGTSLQMIADALGVTKAAVYYHFKTKAEIAEAVAEPGVRDLHELVSRAAAQKRRGAQVDLLLEGFVDLVVRHRGLVALFSSDPGLVRAIENSRQGGMEGFGQALVGVLSGPDPTPAARVNAIVTLTGIAMAGGSADLARLGGEQLRTVLLDAGRRLLSRPRRRALPPGRPSDRL